MKKVFLILIISLVASGFFLAKETKAGSADNVSGFAWSENIGWISFNNTSGGGAVNYGVNIDSSTGVFSGYAWSENIGWISFNRSDTGVPPAAPYNSSETYIAKVDLATKEVSGWARVLAYGGSWDGWIKLRGTNYGVWIDTSVSPAEFRGWAWSDMVVGWISFNDKDYDGAPALVDYQVVTNMGPAPDFSLSASPTTLKAPQTSGTSDPYTGIALSCAGGFNSNVSLSAQWCSGLTDTTCSQSAPSGLTTRFGYFTLQCANPNSNLYFDTAGTPAGTYYLRAQGIGGGLTRNTPVITLEVVSLTVALSVDPSSGISPLNDVDLTSTVGGTAAGNINYKFDCADDGTWDYTFSSISDNPKTVIDACDYASEGTHVAKVRVERDVANPAEGTATVTVTVPNQPPIAVATISKDGTNYADSIAVTQGISTHIYLSASGSSDPDGWTDSVNGVSSGGKCEWNSDLNQGPPTFERTINNPASPSACNIDLGNLTFNDAPGAYTYQALRITDKPGAVSNIDTVTVNVVCQCTSGACCDGCNYRPNTYVCGYSVWNSCNGSCQKKRDVYKCTGSSTACPTTDQGDDYENCGSGTACSGGSCSSANYCATNLCRDGGIWHHNCDKQCDGSNNCTVWADTTCSDHCDPVTSGVQDCDETAIDCGGFCGACNIPPSVVNLSVDSPNSTDYCGITTYPPVRVHWQFDDTGDTQSAFQIKVLQGGVEVIDTGKEFSVISREYVFQNSGEQLSWNTAYTWKVKVWDSLDVESGWVFGPAFSTSHAYPDPDFTLSSPNPSVDEVVSFNPDNSQPYGGAAITNYQWTITQGSGSFVDSTTSVSRYPSIKFSTRANKVELRVTDSSGYACYKEKDVDVQLPLPEWREIAPTSFLEKFLANISMGFSQIFDFF